MYQVFKAEVVFIRLFVSWWHFMPSLLSLFQAWWINHAWKNHAWKNLNGCLSLFSGLTVLIRIEQWSDASIWRWVTEASRNICSHSLSTIAPSSLCLIKPPHAWLLTYVNLLPINPRSMVPIFSMTSLR